MFMAARASALAAFFALAACGGPAPDQVADAIYVGGDIVTMDPARPAAGALAIKDGKILALGEPEALERAHRGESTRIVDLDGKALLPGFLDAHSHYINSLTVANQANVYAPPAGPGKDVASIVAELVKFRDARKIAPGEIIQAYGYDDSAMPDGRALNRDDLDAAFPDNPVLVNHVSMHGAVLNSAALKKWNFTSKTKTPPGGVIVRKPGTNEPYGLIMETAYLPIFADLPKPTREQEVAWSRAGQMLYAQAGITTAHEGATHAADFEVMQRGGGCGRELHRHHRVSLHHGSRCRARGASRSRPGVATTSGSRSAASRSRSTARRRAGRPISRRRTSRAARAGRRTGAAS